MGSTKRVVGLDFRITLLRSCSDTGQDDSRTEDEHKSGHTTGEEEVCWSRSERISVKEVFPRALSRLQTLKTCLLEELLAL